MHCPKCGAQIQEGTFFCSNCGNQIPQNFGRYEPVISPRNIAVAIILSLVTCGLYSIYWMIKLNDEINQLAGEADGTSGVMVFLFSLVTCGIYMFYWLYKMGERCDKIHGSNQNSGIIYLVMGVFGFSIIGYCLMQDTINKAIA